MTPAEYFERRLAKATEHGVPIAGSVGRAAILGEDWISPVRPTGTLRDIDIINVGQHAGAARQLEPTRGVFDAYWLNPFVINEDGQDHLVYPGIYPGIPPVPPKVKIHAPLLNELLVPDGERTINSQRMIVLRPEAQLALDNMRGPSHPKNKYSVKQLAELVQSLGADERIAPRALEPFEEYRLRVASLFRLRLYHFGRKAYHGALPIAAARKVQPVIKATAKGLRLI